MWIRVSECVAACLLLLTCVCSAQVTTAAGWMEKGNRELDEGQFTTAADSFRRAAGLDPTSATPYILLTRALVGQVSYNLRIFPDVNGVLPKAENAAKKAVDLAPLDPSAWCVLGSVDYKLANAARDPQNMAVELNAADRAFQKALAIDRASFEAHYDLGIIALETAMAPLIEAARPLRGASGKPPRIQDPERLKVMQERYGPQIDTGISHMRQALTIDPKSWQAMHQMAGLLNERSLIENTDEKAMADHELANDWQKKADAANARLSGKPPTSEQIAQAGVIAGLLNGPSPLSAGQDSGTMLVVLPEEAEKMLVKKVDPVYPEIAKQAGLGGDVRLRIWVDKEGRVKDVQLLSGDPQLVASARAAVWKWEFKPLVVNREPQEFMTMADIKFVR